MLPNLPTTAGYAESVAKTDLKAEYLNGNRAVLSGWFSIIKIPDNARQGVRNDGASSEPIKPTFYKGFVY